MENRTKWRWTTRIAFRFTFVYFVSYLSTAAPVWNQPLKDALRALVLLVSRYVPGVPADLSPVGGGTGNSYVMALGSLFVAALVTPVWCVLGRKAESHERLHLWLRWAIRYFVLAMMVIYGVAKVLQFPAPPAGQLIQPLGDLSRMELLWAFMGTSQSYTLFAGAGEVLAGLLLLSRRTATLGALGCVGVMSNVWMMNAGYDVPVKVLSFHLLLMGVFLVIPDVHRLAGVFLFNRAVEPADLRPMLDSPWLNQGANVLRGLAVAGLVVFAVYVVRLSRIERPRPPLYGVWSVEELEADGIVRPPLVTDEGRWRRVIFDLPQTMVVQRMSSAVERYSLRLDLAQKMMRLSRPGDSQGNAQMIVEQQGPDVVTLAGSVDGHYLKARLKRVQMPEFRLTSGGPR